MPAQTHLLAFLDRGGELDRNRLARRQRHGHRAALVGVLERNGEIDHGVLALGRPAAHRAGERVPARALRAAEMVRASGRTPRAAKPAHEFLEDILGVEPARTRPGAAPSAARRRGIEPEAREFGVPFGVDLATVILPALGLVRKQVIGRRRLGELFVRRFVVGILVRVQHLGQLAISALDVLLACALGHPQHCIRIAHSLKSPRKGAPMVFGDAYSFPIHDLRAVEAPQLCVLYGHGPRHCPEVMEFRP